MKSSDFLKNKLSYIHNKYPHSKIRYEYRDISKSHIIEILPLEIFNSEEYMEEETKIDDEFTINFPDENLVFVSEESLNKILNPTFQLGILEDFNFITYEPVKNISTNLFDLESINLEEFSGNQIEKIKININISVFENNFITADDIFSGDNIVEVGNNNYALAA